MPDYREVYQLHAGRYDTLVSHEDHQGNLTRALLDVMGDKPLDVVETGAGTGRLTRLMAPRARSVKAFDAAAPMLDVAKKTLPAVTWGVALHDSLPVPDASADLAIEGWAFGHALGWNPDGWREDLTRWVLELERVVRPGGALVMIETMGTGVETPFEGGHSLEPFHAYAVETLGFSHRALRTDYAFKTVDEAVETLGFFFGERLTTRIRENRWTVVPECTGLYWRPRR